jgi:hypothetical protein
MGANIGSPSTTVIGEDTGQDLDFADLNREEIPVKVEEVPPKIEEEVPPEKEEEEKEGKRPEEEAIIEPDVVLANGHTRPSFSKITAKYKDFFKDFPEVREAMGRERELTELYDTVEDAQTARQLADDYRGLEEMVSAGTPEGTSEFLTVMKDNDENIYQGYVSTFLPALLKADRDMYNAITAPIIDGVIKGAYQAGISSDNKNLQAAAAWIAKFIFGDVDYASGKKAISLPKFERTERASDTRNPEQERIDGFWAERAREYELDTQAQVGAGLTKLVQAEVAKIDPENELSAFDSEYIADKVCQQVKEALQADNAHMTRMKGLWGRAAKSSLSGQSKTDIISAFLSRARSEIPALVKRMRDKTKTKRSEPTPEDIEKGKRKNTVGGGGGGTRSRTSPGKVDYSKVSDRELLDGKS